MSSLSTGSMDKTLRNKYDFFKILFITIPFYSCQLLYAEKFTSVNEKEAIPHQSKNEWTTKTCADRMLLF